VAEEVGGRAKDPNFLVKHLEQHRETRVRAQRKLRGVNPDRKWQLVLNNLPFILACLALAFLYRILG
jgi:hypothetical protein